MHSCTQHVHKNGQFDKLPTIIWGPVTLLCMYIRIHEWQSTVECIRTRCYTHQTWSTWSYLVSEVHIGSMLNQLCHNPHTPPPSCPREGCLLILRRVQQQRQCLHAFAAVTSHVQTTTCTINSLWFCFIIGWWSVNYLILQVWVSIYLNQQLNNILMFLVCCK